MNKLHYKFLIFNFIFLFTILYFIFYSFIDERGYIKIINLKKEIILQKNELRVLNKLRYKIENKVNLFYSESIDRDNLDELAREYFGLIGIGEIVIYKK